MLPKEPQLKIHLLPFSKAFDHIKLIRTLFWVEIVSSTIFGEILDAICSLTAAPVEALPLTRKTNQSGFFTLYSQFRELTDKTDTLKNMFKNDMSQ